MKKILLFIGLALLSGCKKDDTKPEPPPVPVPGIAIEVGDITAVAAVITATPESDEVAYWVGAIDKATLEADFKSDLTACVADAILQAADAKKLPVAEWVEKHALKGPTTTPTTDLEPKTDYLAYAAGIDAEGIPTAQPVSKAFRTTGEVFAIEVTDITTTTARVTYRPLVEGTVYFHNVIDKQTFAAYHDSDVATFMHNLLNDEFQWGDTPVNEIVQQIATTGEEVYPAENLTPGADYIAFAVGLADDGTLTTDPVIREFATERLRVDMTFDFKVLKSEWDNIDFEVKPSSDEFAYWFSLKPAVYCASKSDEELLAKVMNDDSFIMPYMYYQGKTSIVREEEGTPYTYYLSDTGYVLLVFGYDPDTNVATTDLARFEMRTEKPAASPAACTFAVEPTGLTARSVNVQITPSDVQQTYAWEIMDDELYQAYKNRLGDYVADYVAEVGIDQLEEIRVMGEDGFTYNDMLTPNTTYYIWAVCMDENGLPSAEVFLSEPIRTPEAVVGTATCEATLEKYFDGDEVYALDPDTYADAQGLAYVSLTFTHSDDASSWYGGLFEDDLTDPAEWTDEEVYATLSGNWDYSFPTGVLRYCAWDKPYTVLAFAKGKDKNYGPVHRKVYTFTEAGASPISEFEAPEPYRLSSFMELKKAPVQKSPLRYRPIEARKR